MTSKWHCAQQVQSYMPAAVFLLDWQNLPDAGSCHEGMFRLQFHHISN